MNHHIVLLGDSIFDNAAYTEGGPDVVTHLRGLLPAGARATLLAVDGSVTSNVEGQLQQLPADATHLVVSVGGNDGLAHLDVLQKPVRSVAAALGELDSVRRPFLENYRAMLGHAGKAGKPLAVCTVYEPRFPEPQLQAAACAALQFFNDCILREAFTRGLPVLDLRLVCSEDADYANPIEPGVQGGAKIARALLNLVATHDFNRRQTVVYR